MSGLIDGSGDKRFASSGPIKIEQPTPLSATTGTGGEIKPEPARPLVEFVTNRLRDVSTGEVLSNLNSPDVSSAEFNHGLIMFDEKDKSWVALCCPSPEAIEHSEPGQDKLGVIALDEGRILILQADGVGSSYDAQNAAGRAVRLVGERGTMNLQHNLEEVGEDFQIWGNQGGLAKPRADLPDLVIRAHNENRVDQGTQTTFNQYLINTQSGSFLAYVLGDGYVSIVRENSAVERIPVGDHHSRLTTRRGVEGNAAEFMGRLQDGDTIFIYSDGLDGIKDEQLVQAKNSIIGGDQNATKTLLESQIQELSRDDDRSLFVYTHHSPKAE